MQIRTRIFEVAIASDFGGIVRLVVIISRIIAEMGSVSCHGQKGAVNKDSREVLEAHGGFFE
jgi:hypothetical protein